MGEDLIVYLFQRDTRERGEVRSHGGRKVTGAEGRPWIHAAGGASVETVTIRLYHEIHFLRGVRRGHQVDGGKT